MKQLQTEFIKNVDKAGDHKFVQLEVNPERTYALYKRLVIDEDMRVFGYEVIAIKHRLKGQLLPNGSVEEQDRECYPGVQSFGKKGWFFPSEESARKKYNQLISPKEVIKIDSVVKKVSSGKKRGKARKYSTTLTFPPYPFTVKDLMDIHNEPQPTVYLKLKTYIEKGEVKEIGSKKNPFGRGKPTKIYQTV